MHSRRGRSCTCKENRHAICGCKMTTIRLLTDEILYTVSPVCYFHSGPTLDYSKYERFWSFREQWILELNNV